MAMEASQDCLSLIKESEGLHRKLPNGDITSYVDPVGVFTIGYGSIHHIDENRPIKAGDIINVGTAERWLKSEMVEKEDAVNALCTVPLTQGMFDALVSFTFNLGRQALKESTLLRKLNGKDYEGAAREFERWVRGGGSVLPGLVIRRNKEEALFRRDGFPDSGVAAIPSGTTTPTNSPYQPPELPLKIQRTLDVGMLGEDCYLLNCALARLGYLETGTQPNSYTTVTKEAVAWFQGDQNLRVDGIFGPDTKARISAVIAKAEKPLPEPMAGRPYCRLSRKGKTNANGLEELLLQFISPQGNQLAALTVVSGAPSKQRFRLLEDGVPGSLEPIPQSRYFIADIDWAGAKDDYKKAHPHKTDGIGPVFVPLIRNVPIKDRERNGKGGRDAFGFHVDWNFVKSGVSPGSAGCVCPTSIDDLKELVRLLRLYDPRDLFVDWGLL